MLNSEQCYQALLTHDARFDGVFFVGVSTTRIYCRTVCTARTPRPDRCTFYPSAAAAERAGFRPCLRCRPELAPGSARIDSGDRLASDAAARIEGGALAEGGAAALAQEMGISERHLRRVVAREFGVSPIQLAQTQRLLLAKRLLSDTDLSVGEVAFASGFSSLRRFNVLFRERYRLSPTDLRRSRPSAPPETLVCEVSYRPPLDWDSLLAFLVGRASQGVEARDGQRYLRTVRWGENGGWITVEPVPARPALRVTLAAGLAPVLRPTLARVRRLFDLQADPITIAAHLGPLADAHPGLRVPGAFDGFEMAVRAVLGQQVTVQAASTLAGRFAAALGEPGSDPVRLPDAPVPHPGTSRRRRSRRLDCARHPPTRAHSPPRPRPRRGVRRDLPGAGRGRGRNHDCGSDRCRASASGPPSTSPCAPWPGRMPSRTRIWASARRWAGSTPKRLLETAERWRPWRAYAAMHLWKSLETPTEDTP